MAHQSLNSHRIRFLQGKAVAAIDLKKVRGESQPGNYGAAEASGLVRQDSQLPIPEFLQGFKNPWVGDRVIEQVAAIIIQEKSKPLLHIAIEGFISQRPLDQNG